MGVTRRAVLLGSAGAVVAGGFAVDRSHPGIRRRIHDEIWPAHHEAAPTDAKAQRISGNFRSDAMNGATIGWRIAYPPGHRPGASLPVCIAMPGRGGDHTNAFDAIYLDRFLTRVVNAGTPAFAIASVDGGDHAYWHPRSYGENPMRMLQQSFVPLLTRKGLQTDRLGLIGWSMGGYGVLMLAEYAPWLRVRAVAASSPALWHKASQTPAGAFDSAEDFARHDVFAGRPKLARIPVRIACGQSDPFFNACKDFLPGVPRLAGTDLRPGGHDDAFWRDVAPGQLDFMGRALSS